MMTRFTGDQANVLRESHEELVGFWSTFSLSKQVKHTFRWGAFEPVPHIYVRGLGLS